jgi:lysophospholipase L1-like esterase
MREVIIEYLVEGFTWEDYNDRLHLNAQGHEKRALAALEALSR